MYGNLSHFDQAGNAVMVDVSEKAVTRRTAVAGGSIFVNADVMAAVVSGTSKKGDVLGVARVAGIMAVKNTSMIIPMCHTLLINKCSIDFKVDEQALRIDAVCTVKVDGKTGVEMEALTGVSAALLTIYDMCKAIDRSMTIGQIRLLEKTGGKSGTYRAQPQTAVTDTDEAAGSQPEQKAKDSPEHCGRTGHLPGCKRSDGQIGDANTR